MDHTFIAAPWNIKICSKCAFNELAHSDTYTCEACSNVGSVEPSGKMLLCAACIAKENAVVVAEPVVAKLSIEQIVNQVDRLLETNQIVNQQGDSVKSILDEAIKGDIKQYKDFFNAKMPDITELEAIIAADETIEQKSEALAIALRKRVNYLARVLFQTRASQVEIGAELKTIQHYMSTLIPKLRNDIRADFAANTPNYTPQVIKTDTPKVRAKAKNPEEKLAESYAKTMKIPFEQALKLIRSKLKDDCVCSVTPGMCKVHNNISQSK